MITAPELVDHLIIGGGPAGSMAALRLAARGRQVVLLEKEPAPHHKVCGEFLSREAVHYLHQAGIDPLQLGAAIVDRLRMSSGNAAIECSLPFQALSLSRRVLDQALLARAEQTGCRILRGFPVDTAAPRGNEWLVTLGSGESLRAKTVFLATGKHDLRGFVRTPARQGGLIGFKLHWRLVSRQIESLRGCMELFLFSGGYGGLSLVENATANLCLVVRRSTLRVRGGWPQLLASILVENRRLRLLLESASPLWPRPLAISPIPYGYLAADTRGPWRVGDQAAVIPSFTGDGISIALHSAVLATQMFLAGKSEAEFRRALRAQLRGGMSLATWLSRAAVTRAGRASGVQVFSLVPAAMRWIAASTRIPQSSLVQISACRPERSPA